MNDIIITRKLETSQIMKMYPDSLEFKEYLIKLVRTINSLIDTVDNKQGGLFNHLETVSGNKYTFDTYDTSKGSLLLVVDFGALPNNTVKSVAHGLDSSWSYKFVKIYGVASNSSTKNYIPIPYASSTASKIVELYVDSTNVNIKTGKDMTSFDTTYVILEYLE